MKATNEVLNDIERNKTRELSGLPNNKKVISVTWVFKIILKPDESIAKHKAQLVARGFM